MKKDSTFRDGKGRHRQEVRGTAERLSTFFHQPTQRSRKYIHRERLDQ
jgi:hypothetical protein